MIKRVRQLKAFSSSIRDHVSSTGHSASVEDFCILDNLRNELDLLIHEGLLILRDVPHSISKIPQYPNVFSNTPWVTCFLL